MAVAAVVPAPPGDALCVIALISGGKDSFYSILHCQANGHRVVALANLCPSGTAKETVEGLDQCQTASQSRSHPTLSSSQQADHNKLLAPQQQVRVVSSEPHDTPAKSGNGDDNDDDDEDGDGETDLNSFMYQTVGHQIIPLYAQATGLPLYRQSIVGTAVHHGLSYDKPHRRYVQGPSTARPSSHDRHSPAAVTRGSQGSSEKSAYDEEEPELEDETESLVPLLRTVLKAHPGANALCTGAILSTYQRTRIESVALRLGLIPLSYLWQFTELPASVPNSDAHQYASSEEGAASRSRVEKKGRLPARDDARLLRDMEGIGLEARIVKVASAGLDEGFLWENVASETGVSRVERAMRRFGAAGGRGTILGEGGEYETLVLNGPSSLFRGRIVVSGEERRVVREGGGCAWLSFCRADVVLKDEPEQAGELPADTLGVRIPGLLDPRFEDVLVRCLLAIPAGDKQQPWPAHLDSTSGLYSITETDSPKCLQPPLPQSSLSQEWSYFGDGRDGSLTTEEQTVSVVNQIRHKLADCSLSANAITNSVIVLRHMSDFPIVNERYGSLFHESNPPSRVTISCGGELLPRDATIAVYLTVQLCLQPHHRRGLHVQSRSYWAPANIGPYSQAIGFPLLPQSITANTAEGNGEDAFGPEDQSCLLSSPFAVSVAGQIPLLPASMTLPPRSRPDHIEQQITLALQHLWRVGIEMQVRWWTSAVAYFPVTSSVLMQRQVLLAAAAWRAAHMWPDREKGECNDESDATDEDDAGPDLWDQRYNAQFMTYGGANEEESFPLSLPNWNLLKGLDTADDYMNLLFESRVANVPFFFAAEVEELPRQAGVEWHAHLGLTDIQPRSIMLYPTTHDKLLSLEHSHRNLEVHHVIVDTEDADAVFVQTMAVLKTSVDHDQTQKMWNSMDVLRSVFATTAVSLAKLLNLSSYPPVRPKITYTGGLKVADDYTTEEAGPLVPCYSLWDSHGHQLEVVSIFETRTTKSR